MDYSNIKHNPKFKKTCSKEGIVCFKIREARSTGWLSLNDMKLWKVPEDVYDKSMKLLNLHHLYMSRCHFKGTLPVEIGYLTKLVVLDVSINKLTNIPANLLTNLTKLEVLDLSANKLRSLPYTIEALVSLKELNLAQNQLVAVPHTLNKLGKLQLLDLSHNMIKLLQSEIFVGLIQTSLKSLKLNDNMLDRLPRSVGGLQKLKELNVANNELYFLPKTARSLEKLQTLHFSGNKWTNPAPMYQDCHKTVSPLNSSFGVQAHNTLRTLIHPQVL